MPVSTDTSLAHHHHRHHAPDAHGVSSLGQAKPAEYAYGDDDGVIATGTAPFDLSAPMPSGSGTASGGAATLPTTTAAVLDNPEWRWNADYAHGTPVTVTFSWMTQAPSGYSNFHAFTAAEQAGARAALAEWAKVANVTFQEVSSGGQIQFGDVSLGGPSGYTTWVGTSGANSGWKTTHADVMMNYDNHLTYGANDFGMRAILHEIGHALGLKHTFDTQGPTLSGAENTAQYSVMSYDNVPNNPDVQPSTPQLYDMAGVQYLYGANTHTYAGNTTWMFSNSHTSEMTIWDGGGTDVLSAMNQSLACTIDLNAGHFSSIGPYGGGAHSNIAIAQGCTIENGYGGTGNDVLVGNGADNVLYGNGGADKLTGGAGANAFCYDNAAQGGDTISDFKTGSDHLEFFAPNFGLGAGVLDASHFVTVAGAFNGANGSGAQWAAGHPVFVFDGTGALYYDANGANGGFAKIATLTSGSVHASDIALVNLFTAHPTTTPIATGAAGPAAPAAAHPVVDHWHA